MTLRNPGTVPIRLSGTLADRPAAADMPENTLYIVLDKLYVSTLIGGSWINSFSESYYLYAEATLANFLATPATGNFSNLVSAVNNNNTGSSARADSPGQYAQIDLGEVKRIDQWRDFGDTRADNSGRWKIQYQNAVGAWVDWVTNIVCRSSASWLSMTLETEVLAQFIRLVCVVKDTGTTGSWIGELEVYHS